MVITARKMTVSATLPLTVEYLFLVVKSWSHRS